MGLRWVRNVLKEEAEFPSPDLAEFLRDKVVGEPEGAPKATHVGVYVEVAALSCNDCGHQWEAQVWGRCPMCNSNDTEPLAEVET